MKNGHVLNTKKISLAGYRLYMLSGAAIALTLISIFLLSDSHPNPEWPWYYMIRPMVIVPLAGAFGGAFAAFMNSIRKHGFWQKIGSALICLIISVFILWISSVIGLAGTYWN